MTNPDPATVAGGLTRGEKLHVLRLGDAGILARKRGWKARAIMLKGLSDWADDKGNRERLTPLGLAVCTILKESRP